MDQEIPLELDHVDGNAGNNQIENLRVLCPNCHAQTPTAKGKNRGNGRKTRGLRLS
jgi:5-methylcytosine-specific restriction endonuclease McrA